MNIVFIGPHNSSIGSHRVFAILIAQFINKYNLAKASLIDCMPTRLVEDVLIFKKGTSESVIKSFRKYNPYKLIGISNPSIKQLNIFNIVDFALVGSLEEKAHYSKFIECLVFPCIEEISSDEIIPFNLRPDKVLSYHGNRMHLDYADKNLKDALKILVKEGYQFKAIYDIKNLGKSSNEFITDHIQWDINTWKSHIANSTIGICPSSHYGGMIPMRIANFITSRGGFTDDIIIRNKTTNNAGRAFVFHQLKIPIAAEISGPHFHIMGDDESGALCYTKESWLKSIKEIANNKDLQESYANKAFDNMEKLYNPENWCKKLVNKIKNLYLQKNNETI